MAMVTVQIPSPVFESVRRHLLGKKTEQVAFLFCSPREDEKSTVLEVKEAFLVPPRELVFESPYHAEVSDEIQARIIKMAWDKKLILGEVHSHPMSTHSTAFSPSDMHGFKDFVPHIWWRLKGGPYVAFVFGQKDFDALAWLSDPKTPAGIDRLVVGGREFSPTGITLRLIQEEREREEREKIRYSRQSSFFGEKGQEKIKKTRVAIVGLGGLGSHVAQQLAYLGVQDLVLLDDDKVSLSNLNRLIGATELDLGQKKVEVSARLIRTIQPKARVLPLDSSLISRTGMKGLQDVGFVFGCVDNDGVRLVLLELCCALQKPYLDLASDIPGEGSFGGRVIFAGLGSGCPVCREELDQEEIRRFFATDTQKEEDVRIYGVEKADLGKSGPSVVSLNGIIASAAVVEFMAFVTGVRAARPHLVYRGEMGILNTPPKPSPGCYYCDGIFSGREKVDPFRHIV